MTLEEMIMAQGGNWHPPMSDGWHPPMMPNVPRDPTAELRKKRAMQQLLRQQQKQNPIHPSQDPFAENVPTPDEMAMTSAAVRYAQTPAEPASQAEMDHQNPFAPTIDRAGKELDVDRPSDLPGSEDNPKAPAEEDMNSKPGNMALRDALMNQINSSDEPQKAPSFSPGYFDAMKGSQETNRNLSLMALLGRSANQMGAINGKVADSDGLNDHISQVIKGNNSSMDYLKDAEKQEISARSKASSKMDKTKLILEFLKLQQGDKRIENQETFNNALLGLRENPPPRSLNPEESDLIKANTKKALREASAPPKAGERDPIDTATEKKLAEDTAQALKAVSAYEGWLKGFDSAGSEAEKINYANFNLKDLQSVEFGPDAINAQDAPRLTTYLQQFRPMDAVRSGGQIFSPQLGKFREEIQRKMIKAKERIKINQESMRGVRSQGAMNYRPGSSGTNVDVSITPQVSSGTVRVRDTDGQVYTIPVEDLEEALAEGATKL